MDSTLQDAPAPQVHRICNAAELEPLTRAGWRLVRVLSESHPVPLQQTQQAYQPPYTPQGSSYQIGGCWIPKVETHYELGHVPLFLLAFDDHSIIGTQTHKIGELEGLIREHQKAQEEYEKRHKLADAQLSDANRNREHVEGLNRALQDRQRDLSAAKAKLEADIGKIRTAIGDKQMREILAETKEGANGH